MEGPRPPRDSEFAHVVQFLDSHLRPQEGWSITSEYPTAFGEANRGNIRIITGEDERVLSHALIRPMIVKAPAGLFKIAGIGSVVTSTEHRKQGLSSQILESCVESARAHGCDFAILWTNMYDYYRRFGFELGGTEISALIDRDLDVPSEGLKFMESAKVAAEPIHRLFSQHTVTSLRTVDETRKYLQIPNSRVFTAWDAQGQLKAYAIEGKGADLNGYVHEWGGGVTALMALFAHIRKTQARPITVIVPSHSQNLLRTMDGHGVRFNEGFLGMIKILNPPNLFQKIKKHARNIGVSDLVLEADNGKYYFGARDRIFTTESERDMVRLLFGPQKASEIHDFGTEAAQILESVLPIQMWIWGWDSV